MNAYAEFVRDHYDEVRKFPTHQRFKELAKMWLMQELKSKEFTGDAGSWMMDGGNGPLDGLRIMRVMARSRELRRKQDEISEKLWSTITRAGSRHSTPTTGNRGLGEMPRIR